MIIFDAIDLIISFVTLRRLWKKGLPVIESQMKETYPESTEPKKLDASARAVEVSRLKTPIQASEPTAASGRGSP